MCIRDRFDELLEVSRYPVHKPGPSVHQPLGDPKQDEFDSDYRVSIFVLGGPLIRAVEEVKEKKAHHVVCAREAL